VHELLHPPLLLADGGLSIAITLGVSLALSAASYFLMQPKKTKRKPPDFTPTTLAQQGDYIPLVIGRRRVGCLMAWAGNRSAKRGRAPGGKGLGGKKKKTDEFYYGEVGWTPICVGPAWKLHRIWADGKLIFDTTISSDDTPSGSALQTTNGDGFRIYWGERLQPVNTFLGDASRVGVASRWPHVCYLEWNEKLLGTTPRWVTHEFDVETRAKIDVIDAAYNLGEGQVQLSSPVSGPNAAYALAQILWESYPHGIGFDHTLFSMGEPAGEGGGEPGSFLDLEELIGDEGQVASVVAADGAEADGVVASLLQDMGALWLKDISDGLYHFRALRHEDAPIAVGYDLQGE
jgi:hypothetical protein